MTRNTDPTTTTITDGRTDLRALPGRALTRPVPEPNAWPVWLGEDEGDPSGLLRSADDGVLRTWPVGTEVNNARHNGAGLLEPMREEAPGGGLNPA